MVFDFTGFQTRTGKQLFLVYFNRLSILLVVVSTEKKITKQRIIHFDASSNCYRLEYENLGGKAENMVTFGHLYL